MNVAVVRSPSDGALAWSTLQQRAQSLFVNHETLEIAGWRRARGGWILFTDADVVFAPDALRRALDAAIGHRLGHLAVIPRFEAPGLLERAFVTAFAALLAPFVGVRELRRPGTRAYFGVGAFNLVRRDAYERAGGHARLPLEVVDDIKLGLLLHRAGRRTRAFLGGADVECHWGTTVPRMIRIMEKNYFAAVDFRVAPVVAGAIVFTLILGTCILGMWTRTAAGITAGLAPWLLALPAAVFARRLGWSPASAAITPLLYPVLFFALVNSAVVTLRQGGVRWRDTFYSLDTLRRGNVR
jgi:hypothetical protein